jgi:hypothetical protein
MVIWLLIVPHALILVPLWIGFWLLSLVALVALVAIMVTGRYPRWIFDFKWPGPARVAADKVPVHHLPGIRRVRQRPPTARGSRMMPGLHPP